MKHHYPKSLLVFLLVAFSLSWGNLQGQQRDREIDPLNPATLICIDYGYNLVGGDLKDRFGNNLAIGGQVGWLFKNSGVQLGIKGNYFFGDTVKQDVLSHLRDANGYILGINGAYGKVKLRERGFELGIFASRVFSLPGLNPRSGIRIDLGGTFLQHWIRLQDDYNTVAQFDDPYDKGYDRLSNGFGLNEFIGYQYMSTDKRINFYAGFSFTQAWTKSRRDYDFNTMSSLDEDRLDLLSGIRVGWILPIYVETRPDEIFY